MEMDEEKAIEILRYILGQNKERIGTNMYDKGITLYPNIREEREAIQKGIEALKRQKRFLEIEVKGECS